MVSAELYERIRFRGRPRSHPDAVVTRGDVRFTVLTPRMLRLEWSETGEFEDRATYAFPTRYTVPPAFSLQEGGAKEGSAKEGGAILQIDTGSVVLRYVLGTGRFTAENLDVTFHMDGKTRTWRPGMPDTGNLRGTLRTLDRCTGDAAVELGLLSRDGWSLFDDSRNVIFGDDGWVGPRPDCQLQDWYFFAYGHDYIDAIQEYATFGGAVPLVPRFILGGWWSRYWAYSAQDLMDLVAEFEAHGVPLDVFVIDMDWHTPHAWTGYTWNRELFPDPPAFLAWLHDKGLRVTLNLHPAQGVQAFEEIYPAFARALGIDPKSGEPAPFRIADKAFVQHYFEMLHHPMEDDGVDFWWLDWQQGEISEVRGLDPLPWINHLHFNDIRRRGVRPMLYSRWGGLGNHRYHIGFSGDTYVTWESLQFQPYMTATASNVLYGWWSHDIGGHMGGATEPELYARWVQFGALSPVLRLHSTKDPRAERRPWGYPEPVYRAAKAAFIWRYRLIPYLYTMARLAAESSISLCRPMYYESPESDAAYAARYQYYLGDQMIAAPIVFPADPVTGLAHTDVWLPQGTWIAYDTLETYTGPGWSRLIGDLDRIPMLMKEGAVLPLAPDFATQPPPRLASGTTDALPDDELVLELFPGQGALRVYRDDGLTEAHLQGQYEWLPVVTGQADNGRVWRATVGPVEGVCEALPDVVTYELRFVGSVEPESVLLDGAQADWSYDSERLATMVRVPQVPRSRAFTVTLASSDTIVALGPRHNSQYVESDVMRLLGDTCPASTDIDAVLACGAPNDAVCDAVARLGGPLFHVVPFVTRETIGERLGQVIVGAPEGGAPVDVVVDFSLVCEGQKKVVRVVRDGVTGSAVIDVPFAFEGWVAGFQWHADVTLSWGGRTLTGGYTSPRYFPGVCQWHAAIDEDGGQGWEHNDLIADLKNDESHFETLIQNAATERNVTELFQVRLWEVYDRRLIEDVLPVAYLVARVISPDARDAVLEYIGGQRATVMVNGVSIDCGAQEVDPEIPVYFHPPQRSAVFSLAPGENIIAVKLPAPVQPEGGWFFGAELMTPDGLLITDLAYR